MQEKELIDALIIGDGTLDYYKNISARLQIRHKLAHKDYCTWIIQKTESFLQWSTPVELDVSGIIEGRKISGKQISIRTKCMKPLYKYRERWYPFGKKVIPKDFILTPISLAILYMDDGTLGIGKDSQNYIQRNIQLNTQSFSYEDNYRLLEMVKGFDIKCSIQELSRRKDNFIIAISGTKQVTAFINVVKKIVEEVNCMKYKIDLNRTGKL